MNKAYLLIGGNIGDRKKNLEQSLILIRRECGIIERLSHLYETAAWGKPNQPSFLNQAIALVTQLPALELLYTILSIEMDLGRRRTEKFGPRIIDIDILLFNDEVINYKALKVPHPELSNRRFALEPLHEIAAGVIHPVSKKSIDWLLKVCADPLAVTKLEN